MKKILIFGENLFVKEVHDILSPLDVNIFWANTINEIELLIRQQSMDCIVIDGDAENIENLTEKTELIKQIAGSKSQYLFVASGISVENILTVKELGCSHIIQRPFNHREFIAYVSSVINRKTRITCIGGGTGLFNLLIGIKKIPNVLLTSIVTMSDSGGSSGRLRESMGILPPGDIRRSLVALSNAPEVMNQIIQYRFNKGGDLAEHSFGNLFLAALNDITGSMVSAVKMLGDILNIQGIVLPVTDQLTDLTARFEDGSVIKGETNIDILNGRDPNLKIADTWHEPKVNCTMDVYSSIINADLLVVGPGDLFTSVISNLTVGGVKEAIQQSKAKKIYVCNLMTKPGETTNFDASDHIAEIIKYLQADCLDYVILSNSKVSGKAIQEYAKKGQNLINGKDKEKIQKVTKAKVIVSDIGHETDLVRHDSAKLREYLEKLLVEENLR